MAELQAFTPFSKYVDKDAIGEDWQAIPSTQSTVTSIATLPEGNSKKPIKQFLKDNLFPPNHDIRSVLYKNLIKKISCNDSLFSEQLYVDFVKDVAYKSSNITPDFMDGNEVESYYLSNAGRDVLRSILLCISFYFPQVSHCPMLSSVVALLMHYDNSPSQVFEHTCRLIFSSPKYVHYLDLTKSNFECSTHVLKDLVIKHNPASHKSLQQYTTNPDMVYEKWLKCLFHYLPFKYIVVLFDLYLLEGYKALYRMSVTLLKFYRKMGVMKDSDILQSIFQFIQSIDSKVSIGLLVKKACNLKLVRSKDLKRYHQKQLSVLKHTPILAAENEKMVRNPWDYSSIVRNVKSEIANETLFSTLFCWIPERIALKEPRLVFSSSEQGYNLNTFFQLSQDIEPTLLLIKTLDNDVIGAYCSSTWSKNEKSFFGTGETFIFSLMPKAMVYYWVGSNNLTSPLNTLHQHNEKQTKHMLPALQQSNSNSTTSSVEEKDSLSLPPIYGKSISLTASVEDTSLNVTTDSSPVKRKEVCTTEYFMMADENYLTIGGGNGVGLRLDKTFLYGITEKCDTFNNKPLVEGREFKCSILELFAFGV